MLAKKFRLQIHRWLKEKKKIIIRKSDFFIIKSNGNNLPYSRFGVVISLKVSKSAVKRNRIKRTIFDFIRLNKFHEVGETDMLIIVLPKTAQLLKEKIESELKKILITNH